MRRRKYNGTTTYVFMIVGQNLMWALDSNEHKLGVAIKDKIQFKLSKK